MMHERSLAELLDEPIAVLDLGLREINALESAGMRTIGELLNTPGEQLIAVTPNVDRCTLKGIITRLKEFGFHSGGYTPPPDDPETVKKNELRRRYGLD